VAPAEQSIAQGAAAGASAATLAGSAWTIANDAAAAIFGVPIGVLLAAAAGSFFARTFTPPATFWIAFRGGLAWTFAGAYTLPLVLHLSGWPSSIAASAAFVLSCALQLLAPAIVPVLIRNSPAWIRAYLDRLSGRQQQQSGVINGNDGSGGH
jgi:glucose uptake protein GlcU